MNKKYLIALAFFIGVAAVGWFIAKPESPAPIRSGTELIEQDNETKTSHSYSIESLRERTYGEGEIKIESKAAETASYTSFVVSYPSDGLKLYALMTVPKSAKPVNGFPVIVLNHGYIPPDEYSTVNSYSSFPPYYASRGYLVFKPDYRGHDNSEGEGVSAHIAPDYTVDVLNLISVIKKYVDSNPEKIGIWGHSMGGGISSRVMVVSPDVKATVLFAGVVASPQKFYEYWQLFGDDSRIPSWIKENARLTLEEYGTPESNPELWNSISPYSYLDSVTSPISIHHGTNDADVPVIFSEEMNGALKQKGKNVEYFVYQNGDHNLGGTHRTLFLQRTLDFFDKYLK